MIVSTTTALDGTPVSEYVGVVTGEPPHSLRVAQIRGSILPAALPQ
jgi:uncharacterized protein YbjQ (UPF0145 family)